MDAHAVQVGAWGGQGGSNTNHWEYILPNANSKFTMIKVENNPHCVCSIEFTYSNKGHNQEHYTDINGGCPPEINIPEGQYITEISGTVDSHEGSPVITSLSFKVGTTSFGPYGAHRGTEFSLSLAKGKFTGFYGGKRSYLENLGVYLSPNN